jgi:hypothetical protein
MESAVRLALRSMLCPCKVAFGPAEVSLLLVPRGICVRKVRRYSTAGWVAVHSIRKREAAIMTWTVDGGRSVECRNGCLLDSQWQWSEESGWGGDNLLCMSWETVRKIRSVLVQQKRAHGSAIKHSAVPVPSLPCPATTTGRTRHAELASISCCSCSGPPACVRLRLRFSQQLQEQVQWRCNDGPWEPGFQEHG